MSHDPARAAVAKAAGRRLRRPGQRIGRPRGNTRKVRAPRKRRCRITSGGGDPRESATESRPPNAFGRGKGERVRQERTARLATGAARQTPPGARPNRGGTVRTRQGFVPARRPGWLLEHRREPAPRGMVAPSPLRDGQNPAYRSSGIFAAMGTGASLGSSTRVGRGTLSSGVSWLISIIGLMCPSRMS